MGLGDSQSYLGPPGIQHGAKGHCPHFHFSQIPMWALGHGVHVDDACVSGFPETFAWRHLIGF